MKTSFHIGEILSKAVGERCRTKRWASRPREFNRGDITSVTATLPNGETMDLPVGTRLDVEIREK